MKGVTWRQSLLVFLFLILIGTSPRATHAQVVISEIMYDLKTGSDSGREWIEVYNASDGTIHMPDWSLEEGGTDHAIASVQGGDDLAPGAYAVLADVPSKFKVDWPSYAGQLFDTAFSGGLSNSGESIAIGYVKNKVFTPTDTVVYSNTWGGAGNGDTLERTASDASTFIGASPTPGTGSLSPIPGLHAPDMSAQSNVEVQTQTDTTQSASSTPAASAPVSSYVPPPTPSLYADAGGNRTVIVGADVVFDARAYNKTQEVVDNVRFSWNFGDGSTAEGESVTHHFSYPGRYAVVLSIAEQKFAAADQAIVTAEPAALAFILKDDGGIEIENHAGHNIDISDWIVKESVADSLSSQFMLPDRSKILSGSSMSVSAQTLRFRASSSTVLEYPNGAPAFVIGASDASASVVAGQEVEEKAAGLRPAAAPLPSVSSVPKKSPSSSLAREAHSDISPATITASSSDATTSAQVAAAAEAFSPRSWWFFGALTLAVFSGAAIVASGYFKKREWDIVEENGE